MDGDYWGIMEGQSLVARPNVTSHPSTNFVLFTMTLEDDAKKNQLWTVIVRPYVRSDNKIRVLYVFYDH